VPKKRRSSGVLGQFLLKEIRRKGKYKQKASRREKIIREIIEIENRKATDKIKTKSFFFEMINNIDGHPPRFTMITRRRQDFIIRNETEYF
jgi:hypothetical protein